VRDKLRLKNYTFRKEKSYIHWIKQHIFFHNKRHYKHESVLQKAVRKVAIKAVGPKM
jgi:hypothetical protein